jgi:GTP-binding protein HflX
MIGESIKRTRERLHKVKRQRQTQRRQRERRDAFNISLVGYTNAGKSTLFNALVKARAYAADQLFATLDTTTRQLYLGEAGRSVSLSDTVGFIRDLPHGLIDAFQATLQEAVDADLLLHVVDASNGNFPEQIQEVQRVLAEIGAQDIPQILVFNKTDAIEPERRPANIRDLYELDGQAVPRVFVSARSGDGLDELRRLLALRVTGSRPAAELAPPGGADFPDNGAVSC